MVIYSSLPLWLLGRRKDLYKDMYLILLIHMDAAEVALVVVEGTLVEGHPDVAFGAVVLGEGDSAVCACVGPA